MQLDHGYPRATQDLDIWIAATQENAQRLVVTLKEFGFDTPEVTTEIILKPNSLCEWGKSLFA
jgi:hypothetical protein